ncbi:nucleotidyltransferase [Pararhodonellum marinum]|uniref:nucleotidyltransferase n=1 Tax=Pararhodonellum marinum TaxID=2755358 RepID=UPI00188FF9F7|nr:nucleotidyltransferase [Pararhodonellum marinum]
MKKVKLNVFNDDFKEFIESLNTFEVDYILIGGYAVILHGYNRTTGDLDIWVNPTEINYTKLIKAFSFFGFPTSAIDLKRFLNQETYNVFTFGRPPIAIDIVTSIQGVEFKDAIQNASEVQVQGIVVRLLSLSDLILTKKAAGRFKDLDDIQNLDNE